MSEPKGFSDSIECMQRGKKNYEKEKRERDDSLAQVRGENVKLA